MVFFVLPHALPPLLATEATLRVANCVPPWPHDLEQSDQSDQSFMTQSTGQVARVHGTSSRTESQALPPCAAGVLTGRVRTCLPAPQVTQIGRAHV